MRRGGATGGVSSLSSGAPTKMETPEKIGVGGGGGGGGSVGRTIVFRRLLGD